MTDNSLTEKLSEIYSIVTTISQDMPIGSRDYINKSIPQFLHVNPPKMEIDLGNFVNPQRLNIIDIQSPPLPGFSRKPGNILLSWDKLMDLVPDVVGASAGAGVALIWALPFVGLYICKKLWNDSKVEITTAEASILCALWKNKDYKREVEEENGFEVSNSLRTALKLPGLKKSDYTNSIDNLVAIKAIELEDGIIRLKEDVNVEY